jgi:hypothetical protein
MRTPVFILFGARLVGNDYVFFAGYTVLQFIVLATGRPNRRAWDLLDLSGTMDEVSYSKCVATRNSTAVPHAKA